MSLLDQLALYSCKFDSLFPELTHCLPNNPKNAKISENHNNSNKNISDSSEFSCISDLSLTTSISILE